jgi:hypothetical protein
MGRDWLRLPVVSAGAAMSADLLHGFERLILQNGSTFSLWWAKSSVTQLKTCARAPVRTNFATNID